MPKIHWTPKRSLGGQDVEAHMPRLMRRLEEASEQVDAALATLRELDSPAEAGDVEGHMPRIRFREAIEHTEAR